MDNQECLDQAGLWSRSARIMTLACLIVFMAQMATTVYLPSLPVVMTDLAMTRQGAELSISLFVIGAALPVLFWGAAADRYGRRLPLALSLLLFVGLSLLLATTSQGPLLLILRTLQGVAAGGAAIIARILVRDHWHGDELARRLSVLSIAFITALGGGQWIGGLISRYAHWQLGFVLMAGVGVLALQGPNPAAASGGMWARYASLLRRPGFFWPACAGGIGFAITVTLQEVSPFVLQQGFALEVTTFGSLGLLIGIAYFAGAMMVNRRVARVGGRQLMRQGAALILLAASGMLLLWALGALQGSGGLVAMMTCYCLIIFGQAVLFPNSMALAVSDGREHGAWAPLVFTLALITLLIVRTKVR
ncbi:MFS transporter [Aeromonas dhakensis]|uniref:MFS transporter n=1 Tax=Aeromonas dhakensis TaxID=196024 RepID=UPI00227C35B7|nr:MFS transporter [Aeromonas dhakensis]WAG12584.1 MFS transporter [Aeromonas dhakensis]